VARDGVEPPTPAFSGSTGLTTNSINNLTRQDGRFYCDHSVTSADVRLSVGRLRHWESRNIEPAVFVDDNASPLNARCAASRRHSSRMHAIQVARRSSSSGGRSFRNARYRATSYATFIPPPITRGAENARFCMTKPATLQPTAQNTLRARLVKPLANVRSFGRTTAVTGSQTLCAQDGFRGIHTTL
jgi:hypothetical protein